MGPWTLCPESRVQEFDPGSAQDGPRVPFGDVSGDYSFEALPVKSTGDAVVEALRQAIISGQLRPGQRLKEEDLARSLGTSRTPIRRALAMLEVEGLIETELGHGARVRQWTLAEINDSIEIFAVLYGLAARRACEHVASEDLKLLRESVVRLEHLPQNNLGTWLDEIEYFHGLINKRSRIHRLDDVVRANRFPDTHLRTMWNAPGQTEHSIDGHYRIVAALELRDADAAEREMREHVLETRDHLIAALREAGPDAVVDG